MPAKFAHTAVAMRVTLIVLVTSLFGCTTHFHKMMNKDTKALIGKDIATLVGRIGYPSNKLAVAGATVYVWDENGCTLHVGTDSADRIEHVDYNGTRRDCERYYDALDADANLPPPAKAVRH